MLRLQDQPRRVLERLLARPGELVTRQELQDDLWPSGVNVDFDVSLNAAVRRLRQVLSDDAGQARYIETLPRKGYRFIAPLQRIDSVAPPRSLNSVLPGSIADLVATPKLRPTVRSWIIAGGVVGSRRWL